MRKLILLILSLAGLGAGADSIPEDFLWQHRPLTAVYQAGIGSTKALSTYLSPIPHSGPEFFIEGEWSRPLAGRHHLRQSYDARFGMGFLQDEADMSAMTNIDFSFAWNLQKHFSPLPGLDLGAGAGLQVEGGLLYLPRNSNNPVAARVSIDLTLNASASYNLRLGRLPMRLVEQVSLPSLGAFFSPHYGESYYEIYLGNHSGLARCGWWGNHFGISNLVAAEVPVCGIRLRLGYRLDVRNSYVSNINTHLTTHSCVIGISTDWLNVTRKTTRP